MNKQKQFGKLLRILRFGKLLTFTVTIRKVVDGSDAWRYPVSNTFLLPQ